MSVAIVDSGSRMGSKYGERLVSKGAGIWLFCGVLVIVQISQILEHMSDFAVAGSAKANVYGLRGLRLSFCGTGIGLGPVPFGNRLYYFKINK